MPIYEYRCSKCEHTTEALRPMSQADDPIACEECGCKRTKRQHSVFAAQGGSHGEAAMVGCGGDGCGGGGGRCGGCSGGNCSCCH